MKFEKLTDNKLKIIFTLEDMAANKVSANAFLSNNIVSQKLLQSMLIKAEKKVGFETGDCNLLVEAIESTDGGFVFTITKLAHDSSSKPLKLFFKFECFDNFLAFCKYMKNMNFSDYSRFSLILYNNTYFLSVIDDGLSFDFKSILCEFGEFLSFSPSMEGILNEYGKVIFDENNFVDNMKLFVT